MMMKIIGLLIFCVLLTGCAQFQLPNVQEMFVNFSNSIPQIWAMVTALAYIIGMAFIVRGVIQLKAYGESRSAMSSQSSLKGPMIYILCGVALMFYPTVKSSLLASTFGYGQEQPLAYDSGNQLWTAQTMTAILEFVQLIGVISFIRGWVYLSQSANPSSQSQFGKAMTHIIGGLLAINIQGTWSMFQATFGFSPSSF